VQAITTYIPVIGNFLRPLFFQTIVSASNRMTDLQALITVVWIKGELQQFRATPLPVFFLREI